MCLERARASQTLLSQRITAKPSLLFEQHLRYPLRGHLLARPSFVGALDERQLEASRDPTRPTPLLGQAAPQEVGDRVLEPPVLLGGARLYRANEVIRQIERRLHEAIVPAMRVSDPTP